ncbi:MAG: sodium:solute symporter family protein [Thermoanaerobaculaceae bacterium]
MDRYILAAFGIYVLGLLALDRWTRTGERLEYLLAGRRLTLGPFVATLVATWYGGVLGVGEFSYRYGLANWLVFGVPYYLAALLFAFGLAAKARKEAVFSIPEQLRNAYGSLASRLGAWLVLLMATPAAYILMLGQLAEVYLGLSRLTGLLVGAGLAVGSVLWGGFRSVVRANLLQFVLMYLAFLLLLPEALQTLGGFSGLWTALPNSHRSLTGGLPWQGIAVWYVIALQTLVEPTFYQRCYAAASPRVARSGVLMAVAFWVLFDFLTTFSGLAARALLPNLGDPGLCYPLLGQKLLPPLLNAVFAVGLFATVSSTAHSYLFLAAATIGHDLFPPRAQERERLRTAVALGLVGAAAAGLAWLFGSVVTIWHHVGSIVTSSLLLPLVAAHAPPRLRFSPKGAVLSLFAAASVSIAWILLRTPQGAYPWGLEPVFPALLLSALIWLVDRSLPKFPPGLICRRERRR